MAIDRKSVGRRIQQQRKALALTQAQLAELAGFEPIYISQLERGSKGLSLDTLDKIARVLKVTPGFLLDGGKLPKDDQLMREVRDLLAKLPTRRRQAILRAIRVFIQI